MIVTSWRPQKRPTYYQDKPEWVPEWVYVEAVTAKRYYNENWEYWVWQVAQEHNCSQANAEDACIRGLKKVLDQIDFVYGPKVAKWYREFMDMDSVFTKVVHPIYLKESLT